MSNNLVETNWNNYKKQYLRIHQIFKNSRIKLQEKVLEDDKYI